MAVIKPTSDTSCDTRKSPTALNVDHLQANMMEIKSFFMNEINFLRQEISSLQLKLQQEKLNQSINNNVCRKDEKITIEDLKIKLDFYQRENQLLKDEAMAKQRTIETILYQNNELLKFNQHYNKNIEQETIVSEAEEKINKLKKISEESKKQIIGVVESTAKETKATGITGKINGTGISRANTVKMRPHPWKTTVDICNYIKPELRHKPDVIIHCGTNDIENEINTVKKIKKLVKEIDEYDKQNPPKIVISSLIKRYDQDFNDDTANINEKLQRFCNSKGLSLIDNDNIDTS